MFAKSSEEGIFKYLCISAYSLFICKVKEKLVLEKFNHIFSKCNSAPHYFSKCNSAPHYFSKCNSATHYFSKCNSALHYFSKCNSVPHYFSRCNSAPHYFSKCEVSASLFFLSVSQRAIEFSFQKHYSAIASIS